MSIKDLEINKPEFCYVFIASSNSVGAVKWGETGYYTLNYGHNFTPESVDNMNKNMGIKKEIAEAMTICSMNKKLNTKAKWENQYNKIIETM